MGAQHSSLGHKGGGIRLRRRAPTMGITTNAELEGAGVDIAAAVKIVESQRAAAATAASAAAASAPGGGGAVMSSEAIAQYAAASPVFGSSPVHPTLASNDPLGHSGRSRMHPSAAALNVEMPPWEVVANLGESEWLAFRAWMEAGWRCKKCGHTRDDHGDHPKAIKLLCSCGVPVPGYKGPMAGGGSGPRPFCPSPSSSGNMRRAVGYASESPDNQVGYLSDQSSRSQSSSRNASPLHHSAYPTSSSGAPNNNHRPHSRPESPRFANELPNGSALSFPNLPQAGVCPRRTGSGVLEPVSGYSGDQDEGLGPSACPHLASLGISAAVEDMGMNGGGGGGGRGGGYRGVSGEGQGYGGGMEDEGVKGQRSASGSGNYSGSFSAESVVLPRLLKQQAEEINIKDKILRAVSRANQIYFIDKEPNGTLVFDFLLSALLDITNSPFGWISSALLKADGSPYLKTHAMTNVAWNKELKAWYAANAHKGLVFTNLNSLHGSIVYTGQPVITNNATQHPMSRGVPAGHPIIEKFFGIPLFTGSELIGIYGVANSPDGYSEQLQRTLEPLTLTIAQMMYAVNERKRRKEAELQLSSVVQIAREGVMSMSSSGQITSINMAAREMFGLIQKRDPSGKPPLANVGADAAPPTDLQLQELIPEIDGRTNYLRKGLDPQAGHRHIGQGKRADGSLFPVEVSIAKGSYGTTFYVAVVRDLMDELIMKERLASCTCSQRQEAEGQVTAEEPVVVAAESVVTSEEQGAITSAGEEGISASVGEEGVTGCSVP